jgi:very-short-patch-repair endonuclease
LVIEIDGGQHYTKDGMGRDKIRDDYIKNLGVKILRFTDREVLQNIDLVVGQIYENL